MAQVKIPGLETNDIVMLQGNPIAMTVEHDIDTTIPITGEGINRTQEINYSYQLEYFFLNVHEGAIETVNNEQIEYIAFYDDSTGKMTEKKNIEDVNTTIIEKTVNGVTKEQIQSTFNIVVDNLSYDAIARIHIYIIDDSGTVSSSPIYSSPFFYALYNGDPVIHIHSIGWERSNIQVVS